MGATDGDAELALSDDESLPWLESEEYEGAGAVDTARIVGFAAVLLVLLAVAIGGLWWWSNRASTKEFVADGSTIEAPAGPYKEKPQDAGGKQFAGTGNVAPGVGEGKVTEGKIKATDAPATPVPAEVAAPSISTRTTEEKISDQAGIGVQVGAYGSRAAAEAGWVTLQRQTDALSGVAHRVVKGQADIGTVYRLQAISGDVPGAQALCAALKADGVACQVKR
ncbi:MAG: SPOR domain-containing protein [Alphaproteobacteria bacterium]|nr:MAG: SPOR domain-containing protein [Alphaproteobacteria bacterium]